MVKETDRGQFGWFQLDARDRQVYAYYPDTGDVTSHKVVVGKRYTITYGSERPAYLLLGEEENTGEILPVVQITGTIVGDIFPKSLNDVEYTLYDSQNPLDLTIERANISTFLFRPGDSLKEVETTD